MIFIPFFVFFVSILVYLIYSIFKNYKKAIQTTDIVMLPEFEKVFLNEYFPMPQIKYTLLPLTYYNPSYQINKPTLACHFQYLGSYYTGCIGGINECLVSMNAIKRIIEKGYRVFHFKIDASFTYQFNSSHTYFTLFSKTPHPIIMTPFPLNKNNITTPVLLWKDVVICLRDYLWMNQSFKQLPCYLYLELSQDVLNNLDMMNMVYEPILQFLGNKIIPKKYGFAGRNGIVPISQAPISDLIGKVVLFSNIYPTRTPYDEVIHGCFQKDDVYSPLHLYMETMEQNGGYKTQVNLNNPEDTYITLSQQLVAIAPQVKENINANPTIQPFTDIYNPPGIDALSYGVSIIFVHVQYPDKKLHTLYSWFAKSNNTIRIKPDTIELYRSYYSNTSNPPTPLLFWKPVKPVSLKPPSEENALSNKRVVALNGFMDLTL
jgi:hypothetical protein